MRNRLLPLLAVSVVTALATLGARRLIANGRTRRVHPARPALETWEYEGGNLHPQETRSLQQQLG